jgi:5-methyltetrahydrofolate--homocysteine methyltransferase
MHQALRKCVTFSKEDWDGLVSLAKEQEREGAHILDVNVDFVGRNGEKICTN